MLAVGAYSGPRAVCGAVAQLAKNARPVTPAMCRMDSFVSSGFISVGRVQTVGDDSEEVSARSKFPHKTLGLHLHRREIRAWFGAAFKLIKLRNYRISESNRVRPSVRSELRHKAGPSSPPWPQASAQFLRRA